MHHNRSLLPDVEVLLSVIVKTSRCSTKLLFVIVNFYSWNLFQSNFGISTKFQNWNESCWSSLSENMSRPMVFSRPWQASRSREFSKLNESFFLSRAEEVIFYFSFSSPLIKKSCFPRFLYWNSLSPLAWEHFDLILQKGKDFEDCGKSSPFSFCSRN